MRVRGTTLTVLGREVALSASGLPRSIVSRFAPEMTHIAASGRQLLAAPIALTVEAGGTAVKWSHTGVRMGRRAEGMAAWTANGRAGSFRSQTAARLEFDGCLEYQISLRATADTEVSDIRLEVPLGRQVARYVMGLGRKGGLRPAFYDWSWKVENNQDSAWIGDINAGLQFTLKDDKYVRPLNTNFYTLKPLVMPRSWENGGQGGCRLAEDAATTFLVRCHSGERAMAAGETLRFDFRLLLTPFKPLDTDFKWRTRFYHRYGTLEKIRATGANTATCPS